ncbi:hypothetical protein [Mesobacillus sp.]|uniref:hypothetical protein n=1 Tax=Mesobacillus sp. TaxID=2675271 RepID=UPI0039F09D4A
MKYVGGWFIITFSYFITLYLSAVTGFLIFPETEYLGNNRHRFNEENRLYVKYFVSVMLIVVPYVIAGIYVRISHSSTKEGLWISLVPVICERVIIFLLGLLFVPRFLSGWDITSVVPFIQWKTKAFYFSYVYILSGIISVFITIGVAKLKLWK